MKALNPMLLGLVLWTATNWGFAATGASPQTDLEQQVAKASKLFAEGHPVEALKIYESLLPALQSRTPSPQLGSVLNAMSKIAAADGKYDDASRLAKESPGTSRAAKVASFPKVGSRRIKDLLNLRIDTVTDLNSHSLCTFERSGGSTANACVA